MWSRRVMTSNSSNRRHLVGFYGGQSRGQGSATSQATPQINNDSILEQLKLELKKNQQEMLSNFRKETVELTKAVGGMKEGIGSLRKDLASIKDEVLDIQRSNCKDTPKQSSSVKLDTRLTVCYSPCPVFVIFHLLVLFMDFLFILGSC